MKRIFHFFIRVISVSLLAVVPSYSQPDSSLGFFAMHNGDIRQYHHYYYDYCTQKTYSYHYTECVLGDTLLSNGNLYKIVETDRAQTLTRRLLRLDTLTANVYEFSGDTTTGDYLVDSLRATVGDRFTRGSDDVLIECIGIGANTQFGIPTVTKRFTSLMVGYGWMYFISHGFGIVERLSESESGCYPVSNTITTELCYARMNGQEYGTFVGVNDQSETQPQSFALSQNYPNPFNPTTTIEFNVVGTRHAVSLRIYDLLGREVAMLVSERLPAGQYTRQWDAKGFPSGVYFYRLQTSSFTETKKLILLR